MAQRREVEAREHAAGRVAGEGEGLGQDDARAPPPDDGHQQRLHQHQRRARSRRAKPTVFSTASSPVRSRTDMAMVLPVTSSRVKNTTPPMAIIRNSMLPICFTNEAMNACSVWVRVSKAELAKPPSMALRHLHGVVPGRRCAPMYQPT